MHALRQKLLPPSGVEFATSLKLTPSTLADQVLPTPPNSSARQELAARALCNVVVARTSLLRIFEVREEPAPLATEIEDERDRRSKVRRGTEAVEGEVEMDEQGEGFVNMGSAKVIQNTSFDVSSTQNAKRSSCHKLCVTTEENVLTKLPLYPVDWSEWHRASSDGHSALLSARTPPTRYRHRSGKYQNHGLSWR
jgi:cleavage and polyadenylation specificity factor subunit 1